MNEILAVIIIGITTIIEIVVVCLALYYYNNDSILFARHENWNVRDINVTSARHQSLLQRWLQEEKNIHIEIIATASGYYWCVNKTNDTSTTDSNVLNRGTNEGGCFDTYELALEDALKYALEKLV